MNYIDRDDRDELQDQITRQRKEILLLRAVITEILEKKLKAEGMTTFKAIVVFCAGYIAGWLTVAL